MKTKPESKQTSKLSSKKGLGQYSSQLISRGLNLANQLEEEKIQLQQNSVGFKLPYQPTQFSWKYFDTIDIHSDSVNSLAITPDNKFLISGSSDNTIGIWNLQTNELLTILTEHIEPVNSIVITPDCKYFISGSRDGTIKIWEIEGVKFIRKLSTNSDKIYSLDISPNGKILACASNNNIELFNLENGKKIKQLSNEHLNESFYVVKFSPDGKTLASSSIINAENLSQIQIWHLETNRMLYKNWSQYGSLEISSDGQFFAVESWNNSIVEVYKYPDVKLLNYLNSCSEEELFEYWIERIDDDPPVFTLSGHEEKVLSIAFSPDIKTLVSGSYDQTVKVWSLKTGRNLDTLYEHFDISLDSNGVKSIIVSPDACILVSGDENGKIKIWKLSAE